jgi:hypothetical protein
MGFLGKNKKGGRPAFRPTQRMRTQAEIAVAAGLSHSQIATVLGISRQTFENNFADEMQNGRARRLIRTLCLLDKAATRGSVAAAKFLLTVFSNGTPSRLGKKEARLRAAKEALASSPWADILEPRSHTDGPAA